MQLYFQILRVRFANEALQAELTASQEQLAQLKLKSDSAARQCARELAEYEADMERTDTVVECARIVVRECMY